MSISLPELYKLSALATASYVDLTGAFGFSPEELRNRANAQDRMPTRLGDQFFLTDSWRVVSDPRHPPGEDEDGNHNSPSGLAATLFQRGTSGEKILSIRGTEGRDALFGATFVQDLEADLVEIVGLGIAISQFVDLVNLVLRQRANPGEQNVLQFTLTRGLVPPNFVPNVYAMSLGSVLPSYYWLEGHTDGVGVGGLSASDTLTVVGHSLGGHLAAMLHRLMPLQFTQAVVFNAARYDPFTSQSLTSRFLELFVPWGFAPSSGFNNVSMFDSEDQAPGDDTSLVSSVLSGELYGPLTLVTTEANSHVIEPFMDSLSLQALMASMSGNVTPLTITETGRVLAAISHRENDTDERLLKGLYRLLKGEEISSLSQFQAGLATAGDINERQKFYTGLIELETIVKGDSTLRLIPADTISVSNLIEGSRGAQDATPDVALAYRYALKALNPFIVTGSEALYVPHNQNGELDLYDPATRTGTLTDPWITDRAQMLFWKNIANTQDNLNVGNSSITEPTIYENTESALRISVFRPGPGTTPSRRIVFGGDSSDNVTGSDQADRLYGGGGTDYLRGRGGNDYLEGGTGFDLYAYGIQKNLVLADVNDGNDTILDIDGKGALRYTYTQSGIPFDTVTNTVIAEASVKVSENVWQSADGRFIYSKTPNSEGQTDLVITVSDQADTSIKIKDFRNGDLNIRLWESRSDPAVGQTIFGDRKPKDFDLSTPGVQSQFNTLGNVIVTDELEADRMDVLFGDRPTPDAEDVPGEKIDAGGGNDIIFSDRPAGQPDNGLGHADWILGGAGRDWIEAGAGNDLIEGGSNGIAGTDVGGDIIDAGTGDDAVYGNSKVALSQAIVQGNQPTGLVTLKGDFLSGGAGKDWIIGSGDEDALFGGGGDDLMLGGVGHDNIWGDLGHVTNDLAWKVTRSETFQFDRKVYRTTFSGTLPGDVSAGGADVIYGGSGNDWIFAGVDDDFVDAGADKDVVFGGAGSDVLIGGAGNDDLSGDDPGVVAGADEGADYLDGGDGDDVLHGNGGDDILIGGRGVDELRGGSGKDTYVFNRGDGIEIIVDTAADAKSPEASVVVLGDGVKRSDIKFGKGSLLIDLGPSDPDDPLAGNDQLHFVNFNSDFPTLTAAIGEIHFADGEVMTYDDVLAQGFDIDGTPGDDDGGTALIGTSVTDRIRGFAGSDELEGRDGDDVLTGDGGADRLDAGNGNDVLDGGAGNDWLAGGMGSDTYRFVAGDGIDTLTEGSLFVRGLADPEAVDAIAFGDGIVRDDVTLLRTGDGNLIVRYGPGDEILVEGQYSVAGADIEAITFADGQTIDKAALDALETGVLEGSDGNDELYGTAGNDVLRGNAGDDYLDGGPTPERRPPGARLVTGDDVLDGGMGGDTYALYWGMGADRIIDTNDGATNTLALTNGATFDSIRTSRDGDDLLVRMRGSTDGARIENFFTDGGAAAWQITSDADGDQPLLELYATQSATDNAYAVEAMADYRQQLLGEWRARGQSDFQLPDSVYVTSTWSQTTAQWTTLVNGTPQTVTLVNEPVTSANVQQFGTREGNRILPLSGSGTTVVQYWVDPLVVEVASDDAFIGAVEYADSYTDASLSFSFDAGGGGPFGNSRTYTTGYGTLINTIVESSTEGWIPLNLRQDNLGQFRLNVQQIVDLPVIEVISAGDSDNEIEGALENDANHVALIDAGAGDDFVTAGLYDFVYGNDGDDEVSGGAFAFGGDGFDTLYDGSVMAGGADDDFLSGGEGETTFSFRSDEPGWDWVEDQNGISLNEFVIRAGLVDSASNLVYGGKYRLGGETSFQFQMALATRFGAESSSGFSGPDTVWSELEVDGNGPYRYAVLGETSGFPRGVPDRLFKAGAPAYSDGYYTWVFNSVEDAMRDFADLGMAWDPAAVQVIPDAPDLSLFTADNYGVLRPFFESGVLEMDTVEFADFQNGVDELAVGFVPAEWEGTRDLLRLVWGDDKIIDIELPSADDLIGHGIEQVRLGQESFYIGELVDQAYEEGILGTPFEDYLLGTDGDDHIRGLGNGDWDLIEGGPGNDVLSGGPGLDEFLFLPGDGIDTIVDGDAEDIISFLDVLPEDVTLGLGSLRLGYGTADDSIHFEGFNPDDVYAVPMFGSLQFWTEQGWNWDLTDELTFEDVLARGFDIIGTPGDDNLTGTNIHDRFYGGAGNDTLAGSEGGDTYFFNAGDGVDTIVDAQETGETNRIVLGDYSEADITGTREGEYVTLRANGTGDAIRILWNDETGSGVDTVEFANGSVWARAALADLPEGGGTTENTAPVLAAPLTEQHALEDTAFTYTLADGAFADSDTGDTLTYSATLSDGSALPTWLAFDGASFSGTPANDDVGNIGITVTATDNGGLSASGTFTLAVENVNDAPLAVGGIANIIVLEDEATSIMISKHWVDDVDVGDALTHTITGVDGAPLPAWLTLDAGTGTLTATPTNDDVGTVTLEAVATDLAGASAATTFDVTVQNTNDAPELTAPLTDRFAYQNAAIAFAVPDGRFVDVDAGDTLAVAAGLTDGTALPAWLAFDGQAFSGTPTEFDVGDYAIRVTATDSAGAEAFSDFNLHVSDAATENATHAGTKRGDRISTGFTNDLIAAGKGDDVVHAGAGRDLLFGERGDDTLFGEHGNDLMYGGKGRDRLDGGAGNDRLYGGKDDDDLDGGSGNDVLAGGHGKDAIATGAGENLVAGGEGNDDIIGGTGRDVILINPGDGKDKLYLAEAGASGNLDVLSIGGGVKVGGVSLKRKDGDLLLELRRDGKHADPASVLLKGWYADAGDHQTVATLQLFDEGTPVQYDFKALVARFDAETQGKAKTGEWRAAQSLPALETMRGGEAAGGEDAVQYAATGTLPGENLVSDEELDAIWPLLDDAEPKWPRADRDYDDDRRHAGRKHGKGHDDDHAEVELRRIIDAWLGQGSHRDDLTELDDIRRGQAAEGRHQTPENIAAAWRAAHRWLDRRDAAGEFDSDAMAGAFGRWFAFGSGLGELPQAAVGLSGVANHDLKTFRGITEGLKSLG